MSDINNLIEERDALTSIIKICREVGWHLVAAEDECLACASRTFESRLYDVCGRIEYIEDMTDEDKVALKAGLPMTRSYLFNHIHISQNEYEKLSDEEKDAYLLKCEVEFQRGLNSILPRIGLDDPSLKCSTYAFHDR